MMSALLLFLLLHPALSAAAPPPAAASTTHEPTTSLLLKYYRDDKVDALIARPVSKSADDSQRATREREVNIIRAAMRLLTARGFAPNATSTESTRAIETISSLRTPVELEVATDVLGGNGAGVDLITSDVGVRKALFDALAAEPTVGVPTLVTFAITGDDVVGQRAFNALPASLGSIGERRLAGYLEGSLGDNRELFINRAAMIASAHASAALIPSLISAQYAPPRAQKRGDEAWIAQGKTINYVAGLVPVVGDSSGAFQPIVGTVFEGSVLRIMESVVITYRTEVHYTLVAVVERSTGVPAPPLGFDRERWAQWYANEYPQLARAYEEKLAQEAAVAATKSTPALGDA